MRVAFFIVGPTASGKSDLAADVAAKIGAEIVSADAFQIYRGFSLLTAKPDSATLAKAPHHLIGEVSPTDEMNAAEFAARAENAIQKILKRGHSAFVVGGTGLYVRALTHGLSPLPGTNLQLREQLSLMTTEQLAGKLQHLDPDSTADKKNRRRLVRAIEICVTTGKPASAQRMNLETKIRAVGVFVFRERDELYHRIDQRVRAIFDAGVVDEVRDALPTGTSASQMLGLSEIRRLIAGAISREECIAAIQQATRRYAKRQLTWFRRQSNFEPLNLTSLGHAEAIECIAQKARLSCVND